MLYLTNVVSITRPRHSWLPLVSSPGLLQAPRPPLSFCPAHLLFLWHVSIRYRLKGALVIFIFILGGEHSAAGESVAVNWGEAGMAAEAAPFLVAWVAWCAVTRSAVAGGAVAGGVAKLTLVFTRMSVGAPTNCSSSSVTGTHLLQAGGRDPPVCCISSSLTFQELVQLREAFNGEAAGYGATAAWA